MQTRILKGIISIILIINIFSQVSAAGTCNLGTQKWINGAWNVPSSCTFPTGPHLINGDITVGDSIITIPNNSMLVLDLATMKITFNLGKIILSGNAVIKYIWSASYSSNSGMTACPSGQKPVNPTGLSIIPSGTVISTVSSGRFYCQ